MFDIFKKKVKIPALNYTNEQISAVADAKMIPIEIVNDEVFSKKMMGDGVAFVLNGETIYSPMNGTIKALFPTGHAFGIISDSGVEILVHIGIDTVESKGKGFTILAKQGDKVFAGEPIVRVNLKELSKTYDMTTMLIVTNTNNKKISFIEPKEVTRETIVGNFRV